MCATSSDSEAGRAERGRDRHKAATRELRIANGSAGTQGADWLYCFHRCIAWTFVNKAKDYYKPRALHSALVFMCLCIYGTRHMSTRIPCKSSLARQLKEEAKQLKTDAAGGRSSGLAPCTQSCQGRE